MKERCILVAVNVLKDTQEIAYEMEELENLCKACDLEAVDKVIQNLEHINPKTYVGKGKLDEIKTAITALNLDVVIFNNELTPSQISNLEEELDIIIYDRTYIILEIFKRRAQTKEAILQVEISSLRYILPRLMGMRKGLSRQRGAGGLAHGRGAGETKLELDRRYIQEKIVFLSQQLKELTALRKQQRIRRKKNNIPIVSLVGYTNAGKSSTLNALLMYSKILKKEVFEKDMLFATLETSTRGVKLTNNKEFLLTDTVGFVHKLPHHLVEAFKSTLEEITESDLIIHVVDCSNPNYQKQIATTQNVLEEIGVKDIPVIYAFNKIDLYEGYFYIPSEYNKAVRISAKKDTNITTLIEMIDKVIYVDDITMTLQADFKDGGLINLLKENADVHSIKYDDECLEINATMSKILYERIVKDYNIKQI